MVESLQEKIVEHLKSGRYRPQRPRGLARELQVQGEEHYHAFRDALRDLMHQGRVVLGARGAIVLPMQRQGREHLVVGTYSHKRGGFGFVVPTDPGNHEDLYIPKGDNAGAITGDTVRAQITSRNQRDGKALFEGRVVEIVERSQKQFVGVLNRISGDWVVMPDGNTLTEPILAPDAASRHIKVGTKVVVELTQYPEDGQAAQGVITQVLGEPGEKDVDLKSVIVQFNLPSDFPEDVRAQARQAIDQFNSEDHFQGRLDLTNELICTIDPDDAKDYDDAISLRHLDNGQWQLGVHIADVSYFVPAGSPLDEEAKKRGNSTYFPGFVIPMLPEVLSNGVCSLQEAVPRLCKSAFITYDENARPISAKFANTVIKSRKRLTYTEAQAIIDGKDVVPHPTGARARSDYEPEVIELLDQMNALAKRLQKRRLAQGQLVLDLPEVQLVLDEQGKVVDAVPEDTSYTHTVIEMFMVEANEGVARLLDSVDVPFLRRTHPGPEVEDSERLRQFVQVAGHRLPKVVDRHALQALLSAVRGKPEGFAINLAVLKSLTRAEYSPKPIGHYALASEHYAHFTSPIRRYADLTIHRLLDEYFRAREERGSAKKKMENFIDTDDLIALGKHISFTERRSEDAERELRQVKILSLLQNHIGEEFSAVVTGITNFGVFLQLQAYLVDGLIRYEDLMDDWWDVDERSGMIRGQRTGRRIGIGDVAKVIIVNVDLARRELKLSISQLLGREGKPSEKQPPAQPSKHEKKKGKHRPKPTTVHARGGGRRVPIRGGKGKRRR